MLTVITPALLLGVQAGIEHVGQFSMQISSRSGSVLHAAQQLIEEWRKSHRLASVQTSAVMSIAFGAGPALFDAWSKVPDDLKAALPHGWARWIATAGFVLVLVARLTRVEKADG
ncbi:hypothetical protein [Paraburkholderia sp. J94]|uniref:DUF7940 domain-containing protein n=1 Tax=Paraburkholderia sp. J94 TaxID=2805441 RepID=UPI002AAF82AC|nr:hypothetical protein [Paraburkholderia sp. J94]